MRTREEVSADKLRGGFYTPKPLVQMCLDRVLGLVRGRSSLRVLEPSVGDGAFVRGLASHTLARSVDQIVGVELVAREAARARIALADDDLNGEIVDSSFLTWADSQEASFDVAVGNPPFVRFQFVSEEDRAAATNQLTRLLGAAPTGVANLWVPILLRALTLLRPGGAFAFVVPAEILTGVSASFARDWLSRNTANLQLDIFEPGSFPGVLQEVVVVSGQAEPKKIGNLRLVEHQDGASRGWNHTLAAVPTWTRYLLHPAQLAAYDALIHGSHFSLLGRIARFEVSIVTGANDFFTLNEATAREHGLERWARPLLPRIRHARGLTYTTTDHAAVQASPSSAVLLDFGADRDDPMRFDCPAAYLSSGAQRGISARYKCRIRQPWYRVPGIRAGAMMLSKRSHEHPRMVVNEAGVFTTDTIYRGDIRPEYLGVLEPSCLAGGFHSSVTMLAAEIEGRSFGGGVLELVPGEISRLPVPVHPAIAAEFQRLDETARSAPDRLIQTTDETLARLRVVDTDALEIVSSARYELMMRRLHRSQLGDRALPFPIGDTADTVFAEVS